MSRPIRDRAFGPVIRRRLFWVTAAAVLISVLSFLGTFHWSLDLLSHFRLQFAAAGLFLLAVTLVLRQRRAALAAGAVTLAHLLPVAVHLSDGTGLAAQAAPDTGDTFALKVSHHNLHYRTTDFGPFFDHLDRVRPDVVVLTEMNYARRAELFHRMRRHWRYFAATPGPSVFNVAVFSRVPLTEASRMLDTRNDWPMLHVRICPEANRDCLRLVALHPPPPFGRAAAIRNTALDEAARTARSQPGPVVVAGDLNVTPWSPHFRNMLDVGHLRAPRPAGLTATWLSRFPLFGLQIDHILVGSGAAATSWEIGPAFGSDHHMVTAEVAFAAPRLAPSASAP